MGDPSVTTAFKPGVNTYDVNNESELKDGEGQEIPVDNALAGANIGGSIVLRLPISDSRFHFVFGADVGGVVGQKKSYNDVFGEDNYTGVDCENIDTEFEPNCADSESTLSSYDTSTNRFFVAPKAGVSVDILQMPKGMLRADAYLGHRWSLFGPNANAFVTSDGGVNNTVPSDLGTSSEFFLQAEVGVPVATIGKIATVEVGAGFDANLGGSAEVYNRGQESGADVIRGTGGSNFYGFAGIRWGAVQDSTAPTSSAMDTTSAQAILDAEYKAFMETNKEVLERAGITQVTAKKFQAATYDDENLAPLTTNWDGSGDRVEGWYYSVSIVGATEEMEATLGAGETFASFSQLLATAKARGTDSFEATTATTKDDAKEDSKVDDKKEDKSKDKEDVKEDAKEKKEEK